MRLALALLLMVLAPLAAAAERDLSPELAAQLMRILGDDEAEVAETLARLKALAERRQRSRELHFIVRERAALLIQEEQTDTAREELEATLAGQPEDYAPSLRYLLGQVHLLDDRPELAVDNLRLWAEHAEEPDPSGLFLLGYGYTRLERFAEAVEAIERAIAEAKTQRPQWVEVLAYAYTELGNTDRAVELLKALVASNPGEARWWRQLATVYLLIEDLDSGTAGYAIAAELEALTLQDARRLAQLFGYLGTPVDGAQLLAAVLEEQPDDYAAIATRYEDRMLLAELELLARNFEAAITALENAAALSADGEPQMLMGQLYLQRELYEEAGVSLGEASGAYGENAPALLHYLLAITHLNLGELDAAERAIFAFQDDDTLGARAAPLQAYLQNERRQR